MPIFQDNNGLAVKFFIQKDIPQEIQAELCETITSLGGRVEVKVPRQGFILVQPGTAEEERLRQCWIIPDRPERFIVPYTYIEACKIAGMQLKQIFMEGGLPIHMHVHPSIANPNARAALASRILHSGGDPNSSIQNARVILADPNTEVFHHLIKTYQTTPNKHIESYLWVKKSIEKGSLVYTPVIYKNPGGRRPGEERTQFTEEDERHLCQWIAQKIPYKETGGRTGNRLYQQLCEQADPEYNWVSRHTWQSWRERYKKNAARLDVLIARIVEEKRPAQGQQGQYGYVRQPEEKPKRQRKKRGSGSGLGLGPGGMGMGMGMGGKGEDGNNDDELTNSAEDLAQLSVMSMPPPPPSPLPQSSVHHMSHPHHPSMMSLQQPPSQFHTMSPPQPHSYSGLLPSHTPLSIPPPPPHIPTNGNGNPAEEEMEMEDTEENEWPVRVGNEPPPNWAKRKAEVELEETEIEGIEGHSHNSKRHKPNEGPLQDGIHSISQVAVNMQSQPSHLHSHQPQPPPQPTFNASTLVNFANIHMQVHVIDQNLQAIAKDYRFTLEEVQEFYDKCGEMSRTRRRFQRMREMLSERFGDGEEVEE